MAIANGVTDILLRDLGVRSAGSPDRVGVDFGRAEEAGLGRGQTRQESANYSDWDQQAETHHHLTTSGKTFRRRCSEIAASTHINA
jgi:hypothetical protein